MSQQTRDRSPEDPGLSGGLEATPGLATVELYTADVTRGEHQMGAYCWCGPLAERQPDGSYVFIHRKVTQ